MNFNKLFIILIFISSSAFADRLYPPPPDIINITEVTNIIQSDTEGIASAIAAGQCQFDWTHSLQACAAFGTYDSNQAVVFGMAQRADNVLFNATVGVESGEVSLGIAANWKF